MIAAHNVGRFSGLGGLHRGDFIEIDTQSDQQVYRVTWHRVVTVGSAVTNTASPSLVLEACWPLDALYLTPHRYLVGANPVSSVRLEVTPGMPHDQQYVPVGIPSPIVQQNLTLSENDSPMGSFATTGFPAPTWVGSSVPYSLASAEVNWMIALGYAAQSANVGELQAVSGASVVKVAPLAQGYSGFASLTDLTENVVGMHALRRTATVDLKTASGVVRVA